MTVGFDPTAEFLRNFEAELATYPPDARWRIAGKASKANPHGEDEEWWREQGPVMVQRWMQWRDFTPWDIWIAPDGQPGIELEINIKIDGVLTKMFIDRVFATAVDNARPVIVDIKSGRPPKGLLQLGLYKVAVELLWPEVQVAGGAFWQARTGEMSGVQGLGQFTPQLIGAYMRRLKMIKAGGAYVPNVGSFCSTCDVGKYCAINNGEQAHLDPDYVLMGV